MARIVKIDMFRTPKASEDLLRKTAGWSNQKALRFLEKNNAPILTTWQDIGKMAYPLVKKYKSYGLKVTKANLVRGHSHADGLYLWEGEAEIILHPVLRYYPNAYVKQTILHEIDHLEADIRNRKIRPITRLKDLGFKKKLKTS